MNINKNKIFESFLIGIMSFFFFITPFVDSLNGLLLRLNITGVSIFYKTILIFLLFFISIFIGISKKKFLTLLTFILISFIITFYHTYKGYISAFGELLVNVNWSLKFFLALAVFLILKELVQKNLWSFKRSLFILLTYLIVYYVNLVLGLVGIGFKQYEEKIGSVGFIYAGNEMSIVLIICESVIISYLLVRKKFFLFFLFFLVALIFSILKATKTAIFGLLIIGTLFVIIFLFETSRIKQLFINKKALSVSITFILVNIFIIPFYLYLWLFYVGIYDRLYYWYEKASFVAFLLSNRNTYLLDKYYVLKNFSIIDYFLGISLINIDKIIEIDLIDIFIVYGFFGVLLTYGIIFVIINGLLKLKRYMYPLKNYILVTITILVLISLVAGHMFNSGLAGVPLGIMLSMAFSKKKDFK